MSAKKEIEFNWTEDFERALVELLLDYRTAHRPEGSFESLRNFERGHARDFMRALRTLMESHTCSLCGDSDIAALVDRMKTAHDGALSRETAKQGGIR